VDHLKSLIKHPTQLHNIYQNYLNFHCPQPFKVKKARSGSLFVSANFHFHQLTIFFRDRKAKTSLSLWEQTNQRIFFFVSILLWYPTSFRNTPRVQAFCFWGSHELLCSIRAPQNTLQNSSEMIFHWVENRLSEHQPTYYGITLLMISSLLITEWGTEHTGNHCRVFKIAAKSGRNNKCVKDNKEWIAQWESMEISFAKLFCQGDFSDLATELRQWHVWQNGHWHLDFQQSGPGKQETSSAWQNSQIKKINLTKWRWIVVHTCYRNCFKKSTFPETFPIWSLPGLQGPPVL
jgi:hypothetical protein